MPRFSISIEAQHRSFHMTSKAEEVNADSAIRAVADRVHDVLDAAPQGTKITEIHIRRLRPIGD